MAGNHGAVQKVVDALVDAIEREKYDRAFAESEIRKYLGVTDQAELDFTYDFYVNGPLAVGRCRRPRGSSRTSRRFPPAIPGSQASMCPP